MDCTQQKGVFLRKERVFASYNGRDEHCFGCRVTIVRGVVGESEVQKGSVGEMGVV